MCKVRKLWGRGQILEVTCDQATGNLKMNGRFIIFNVIAMHSLHRCKAYPVTPQRISRCWSKTEYSMVSNAMLRLRKRRIMWYFSFIKQGIQFFAFKKVNVALCPDKKGNGRNKNQTKKLLLISSSFGIHLRNYINLLLPLTEIKSCLFYPLFVSFLFLCLKRFVFVLLFFF